MHGRVQSFYAWQLEFLEPFIKCHCKNKNTKKMASPQNELMPVFYLCPFNWVWISTSTLSCHDIQIKLLAKKKVPPKKKRFHVFGREYRQCFTFKANKYSSGIIFWIEFTHPEFSAGVLDSPVVKCISRGLISRFTACKRPAVSNGNHLFKNFQKGLKHWRSHWEAAACHETVFTLGYIWRV